MGPSTTQESYAHTDSERIRNRKPADPELKLQGGNILSRPSDGAMRRPHQHCGRTGIAGQCRWSNH
jgi:hypothetical protein